MWRPDENELEGLTGGLSSASTAVWKFGRLENR